METTSSMDTLTSEMESKILKQVEFYFSDSNYPRDKFLRAQAAQDEEGYVSLEKIISFKRMKELGATDIPKLATILKASELLQVDSDGLKVKRKIPLPGEDTSNPRTIHTKGWPEDITIEQIESALSPVVVRCVRIRKDAQKKPKGSAFIELENEEKAKELAEKGTIKYQEKDIVVKTKDAYFKEKKEERKTRKDKKKETDSNSDATEPPLKKVKVDDGKNEVKKKREWIRGLIVQIKGLGTTADREQIKESLTKFGKIQYVDYTRGAPDAIIRMEKPEDAQAVIKGITEEKINFGGKEVEESKVLEGEEEEKYWKTIEETKKTQRKKNGWWKRRRKRWKRKQKKEILKE